MKRMFNDARGRVSVPLPVGLITGFSLLLAVVLLLDGIPFLRGGFGWQWPYVPVGLMRGLPLLLAAGIYIAGAWWLLGRTERAAPLVIWALVGAAIIPLTVIALRSQVIYELFLRTVSAGATGVHTVGAEVDWSSTSWYDWPAIMQSFEGRSAHIVLSPPGLPLFYGALNGLLEGFPGLTEPLQRAVMPFQCNNYSLLQYTSAEWASAWFGMLMPLWAALAVIPLYSVARRLSPERVRLAVTWWPLVPALIMWGTSWNTFYPLLSLIGFAFLLVGLERGAAWILGAGLVAGLMTFANFSLVPFILLCGFYTLLHYGIHERSSRPWTRPVRVGIGFGLGLIVPWVIFWFITRLTPFDLLATAMTTHLGADRPYLPWLWLHFWDWAVLTGIPLILLWLVLSWKALRERRFGGGSLLAVALLLTMVVMLLSNTARGETGRVWLFFAPFVLIAGADLPIGTRPARTSWLVVTIGQAALTLALAFTWDVMAAGDMRPPPDSPGSVQATLPVGATFADTFQLLGWDAVQEGDTIALNLNWQGQQQMTTPYWFAALLVTPEGNPAGEPLVWQPLETRYPTTCWQVGEVVGETVTLPLPDGYVAGNWWVSLTAFADVDAPQDTLSVTLPDAATEQQVGLGPVAVSRP